MTIFGQSCGGADPGPEIVCVAKAISFSFQNKVESERQICRAKFFGTSATKQEDNSKIPDWIEDDWGDNFLDEELTEVTELDSNAKNLNMAEVIRPDFQASSGQTRKNEETSNSMDTSTPSPKRNKLQQPRALTTSTIILYILCFLLIVCISFLGFHLLGNE